MAKESMNLGIVGGHKRAVPLLNIEHQGPGVQPLETELARPWEEWNYARPHLGIMNPHRLT